ncbi:Protein kinase C-like protein [Yarrowia sp. C11]|nr:Protein kinase C-like protein [Yarrowia sp. C11]KAG5364581.1 Protein kinase C-like protein [Yarrowia sp. E02]
MSAPDDLESAIQKLYKQIEVEKNIIRGTKAAAQASQDSAFKLQCQSKLTDNQKNVNYLESKMRELKLRTRPESMAPGPHPTQKRANFTKLDLIKYDTPFFGPRIQHMLQQLEFKMSVEKNYKEGFENALRLYQRDPKKIQEIENMRKESLQKMGLLKKSLKRYQDMHIDIDDAIDSDSINAPNIRRPLSGIVTITVHALRNVEHIASVRGKRPETMVTVKCEDKLVGRTKLSRTERWNDTFQFPVDKANEVEIIIYDRDGDHFKPVGLLWLTISDVAEEIRRRKNGQKLAATGWVAASETAAGGHADPSGRGGNATIATGSGLPTLEAPQIDRPVSSVVNYTGPTIEEWFVVEPAGQIYLTLGFEKTNRGVKRPHELGGLGLGRQNAIRKKEDVHEIHGHKFVAQQFYSIMRCALCGDFLSGAGFQCQDCRLTCHGKCYSKVVTKCISKSSTETDPDEEKLNHRIPHRFQVFTNKSANWCCHCGYILPLGRKSVRKCGECGVTAHTQCEHLVPDFCGMSMERANQILSEIKSTKIRRASQHPVGSSASSQQSTLYSATPSHMHVNAGDRDSNGYGYGAGHSSDRLSLTPVDTNSSINSTATVRGERKNTVRRKEVGSAPSVPPKEGSVASSGASLVGVPPPGAPAPGPPSAVPDRGQAYHQQRYDPSASSLDPRARRESQGYGSPKSPARSPQQQQQYQSSPEQQLYPPRKSSVGDTYPNRDSTPSPSQVLPPVEDDVKMEDEETFDKSFVNEGEQEAATGPRSYSPPKSMIIDEQHKSHEPSGSIDSGYQSLPVPGVDHEQQRREQEDARARQQQEHQQQMLREQQQREQQMREQQYQQQQYQQQQYQQQQAQQQQVQQRQAAQQAQAAAAAAAAVASSPAAQTQAAAPTPSSPTPAANRQSVVGKKKRPRIGLDDFNFLAVLGKGNFGKVMLAESKKTTNLYAIKVLKKDFIIENDEVESTRSERRVFQIANRESHPFLLNLYSCFQTENRVYFVMDYVSGGDLMWHIQKEGVFKPGRAQFYAAEVLLGIKHFHDNGVIYRDLKLDNILLTRDGHVKIADYGLCKEDMDYGRTTGTFCGTPEFMAPEILLEQRYGLAVDWWAFGVLIYQMVLGQSPFRGEDEDEIFDAILADEPRYPITLPGNCVSILTQLLTREPERRLGSGPRDAEEIMAHPYFANVNFDDIYHKRIPPPFVPKITSPTDVTNFDQEFTSETPALTPVTTTLTSAMQDQFRNFTWMCDDAI